MFSSDYNLKSHWQKAFIDNVFRNRTNINNTFSKIILNNTQLLDAKRDNIPSSLFKFYKQTSDNIIDISQQRLWVPHPSDFNDPFDCRPGYDIKGYEKDMVLKYIKHHGCVDIKDSENGFTLDEFDLLLSSLTTRRYIWHNQFEDYDTVLMRLLNKKSDEFKYTIYDVIFRARNNASASIEIVANTNIRVACFSAIDRWTNFKDAIHMWSHYADNHKGFCVEYDLSPLNKQVPLSLKDYDYRKRHREYMDERLKVLLLAGLFPVIYTGNRLNISKTKLRKIRIDDINSLKSNDNVDPILYKAYVVKSAKWNYEKEWRIILDGNVCEYYDNRIPFPYIKTIFLGCKMTTENVDTMVEIAENIGATVKRTEMDNRKFVLQEYSTDHYRRDREWAREDKNPCI